ncbi:hypothetical protein [Cellulosilyticum ruminicola]|uniref:hypothetical protein n=1 Tax=Cellulosilyticum ruminicola TaxID=425254 RepID=UPI0006CFDD75|nr:hypothetical protein [Cellulosilyticum ruminicola]
MIDTRGLGSYCCSGFFSSPQGAIIFSAVVALLLIEVMDKDTLGITSDILQAIGEMLAIGAGMC